MGDAVPAEPTTPPKAPRKNRATRWWLAAGTFVVGLLAGAVIAGLLSEGSPTPQAGSGPPSATPGGSGPAGTTVSAAASGSGATAQVTVNDACLRAVNAARDAYTAINDIGDAAGQLNISRLEEIIRTLQPLQTSLTGDVDACRITTRLPDGSIISGTIPDAPTVSAAPGDPGSSSPTTN